MQRAELERRGGPGARPRDGEESPAPTASQPGSCRDGDADQRAVDRDTLAALERTTDRGRRLVEQLVGIYLETSPEHLAALRTALAATDPDGVSHSAHTLRSSSVTIGARRLGELCRLTEQAASDDDLTLAGELAQALFAEYERVAVELEAEISGVST